MPTCVALIPARAGSKRVPNKNVRPLAGHPLMAYSIAAAQESGVFTEVVVSTDSPEYAAIAQDYGARCIARPPEYATDTSPDIEWVRHTLSRMEEMLWSVPDCFSILRPTSPFRTAETIRRAWHHFLAHPQSHSLRGVAPVRQHAFKQWVQTCSSRIVPLMADAPDWHSHGAPGHSRQHTTLPAIYSQTASIEIAWCQTVFEKGSIAGEEVLPFFVEGLDAFDVNNSDDWLLAETLIAQGLAQLPTVRRP